MRKQFAQSFQRSKIPPSEATVGSKASLTFSFLTLPQLLSVALGLGRPPAQARSFLSTPIPGRTHTPQQGQVSTQPRGLFCLELGVCGRGYSPSQLRELGLLVRVMCSSSILEYTPFSWGPLFALKNPADILSSGNACQLLGSLWAPQTLCSPLSHSKYPLPLAWVLFQGKALLSHIW